MRVGAVLVAFRGTEGTTIDPLSIDGDEIILRDAEGTEIPLDGAPMRVGSSDTYHYFFTSMIEEGE